MSLPAGLIPAFEYHNIDTSGNARGHYGPVINYNVGNGHVLSDAEKADAVLRALYYSEMDDRFQKIHEPGAHEYKWAFSDTHVALKEWLESDNGIFWVTGKAGSGKSTFMKFLCGHETTQELLERWSGDKHMVVASHFFWCTTACSELEKTREGMFRTILFHALGSLPDASRVDSARYSSQPSGRG